MWHCWREVGCMCQPVTPERAPLAGQNGAERGSGAGSPHHCGQQCTVELREHRIRFNYRSVTGASGASLAPVKPVHTGAWGHGGHFWAWPEPLGSSAGCHLYGERVMHSGGRRSGDLVTQHLSRASKHWQTQLRVLYCMALH